MDFKSRFGKFFIWLGLILLLLFITADIVDVEDLNAWYLFFGTIFLVLGVFLSLAGRKPPEESARFRSVRKMANRRKKKGDDQGSSEGEG